MAYTCLGCGTPFNSVSAFDKHRTGKHHISAGADRRRCMTENEMTSAGFVRNKRGVWAGSKNPRFAAPDKPLAKNPTSDI